MSKEVDPNINSTGGGSIREDNLSQTLSISDGLTFIGKFRESSKRKKILSLAVILMILLTGIFSVLVFVMSSLDETNIKLNVVRITHSDENSLYMEIEVRISNPVFISVEMKPAELDVRYDDNPAAVLKLPSVEIEAGKSIMTTQCVLRQENISVMKKLVKDAFSGNNLRIRLSGNLEIKGIFPLTFPIDRIISLTNISKPDVNVDSIRVQNSDETGMDMEMDVSVENNGILETTLEELCFSVGHNGKRFLKLPGQGMYRKGENKLHFSTSITNDSYDTADKIVKKLLDGAQVKMEVKGEERESLLSKLSTFFSYDYVYNDENTVSSGFDELEFRAGNISILESDSRGIKGTAQIIINNPSVFSSTLDNLSFRLLYNGSDAVVVNTSGILKTGNSTHLFRFHIPESENTTVNKLISDIFNRTNPGFEIQGIPSSTMLSRLSSSYTTEYQMDTSGNLNANVSSYSINSIGLFESRIDVNVILYNPTNVTINSNIFSFTSEYKENYLGRLEFINPVVKPGLQELNISIYVPTLSLQNLEILSKLSSGEPVEIMIIGEKIFQTGSIIRFSYPIVM